MSVLLMELEIVQKAQAGEPVAVAVVAAMSLSLLYVLKKVSHDLSAATPPPPPRATAATAAAVTANIAANTNTNTQRCWRICCRRASQP